MSRKRKPKTVLLHALYWCDRSGNSYARCDATAYFRDGTSELVAAVDAESGGTGYAFQRAADALEAAGYMPARAHYRATGGAEQASNYFSDRKIPFITSERAVSAREIRL